MQIKFSKEYQKYTNHLESVEVAGATVGAALENLFNRMPQLLAFLTLNKGVEANRTSIKLNGEYIWEPKSLWVDAGENDVLEFAQDVPEGEGGVGKIIAGVVLMVAAVALAAFTGGGSLTWTPWAVGLMMGGVATALGGVAELIMGSPNLPSPDGNGNSSATYTFSGIRNTTTPGTPVPLVYGKHRVGGHLINAYVDVRGIDQFLFAQLGISEGEIDSIDPNGLEINDQPVNHFSDVAAFWRSGTADNAPLSNARGELIPPKETSSYYDYASTPILVGYLSPVGISYTFPSSIGISGISVHIDKALHARLTDVVPISNPIVEIYDGPTLVGTLYDFFESSLSSMDVEGGGTVYIYEYNGGGKYLDFALPNVSAQNISLKFYGVNGGQPIQIVAYTLKTTNQNILDNQNAMYGFNRTENSYAVSLPKIVVTVDPTLGALYTTQGPVDTVKLIVAAPALYSDFGKGNMAVDFRVWYRKGAVGGWTEYLAPPNSPGWSTISSTPTKSEVSRALELDFRALGMDTYQVSVTRTTVEHPTPLGSYVEDIYLKEVNEIIHEDLAYPHTALLGLRIKATDQISGGMPNITSVIKGIKVSVPTGYNGTTRVQSGAWNGTMKSVKEWTDNPVWCLYDLITNTRYGLGNYFKISPSRMGLVLANLYSMAVYCDEYILDNGTLSAYGVAGARPRFSLNLVIDDTKSAIEWLNIICASMRAALFYSEGCIFLDIDRPKTISQLFNMSNIKDYSQSGVSYRSIPNSYDVQFRDSAARYESSLFIVEDQALLADSNIEERKKTLQLIGVTDVKQAKSLGKYALLAGKHALTTVSFKTGTEGLLSTVGDVVGVQHDVPRWGTGGTVEAWDASSNTLTISEPMTFEAGVEYSIKLSRKNSAPVTYGVVEQAAGTETTSVVLSADADGGTAFPALSITPAYGDLYVIGATGFEVKPFRIVSLKRDPDELVEIAAIEYNETLYPACDNVTDVGDTVVDSIYSTLQDPQNVSVVSMDVSEKMILAADGTIKVGINVYYTPPDDTTFWKGAIVYYGIAGSNLYNSLPLDSSGYVLIPDVVELSTYQVIVASVYKNGSQQSPRQLMGDAQYAGVRKTLLVQGKTLPPADVTGLEVTLVDYRIVLSWDQVADVDLAGYEIWQNGVRIETLVRATNYTVGMALAGAHTWQVYAVDTTRHRSLVPASKSLTINAPAAPSVTYTIKGENVILSWNQPASDFPIKNYQVDMGGGDPLAEVSALTYSTKVNWGGSRTVMVTAVDAAGNVGAMGMRDVVIILPGVVQNLQPQVVDNNVLLQWSEPSTHTLPLVGYEIRKGILYASAEVKGFVGGTFNTIFEAQGGQYTYWVTAKDSAGNYGTSVSYLASVSAPPDYVLFADEPLRWDGTKVNALVADYVSNQRWDFWSSTEGWTATGSSLSLQSGDYTTLTSSGSDPTLYRTDLSFAGKDFPLVKVRLQRTAGAGWQGDLYYQRSGITFSTSYRKNLPANPAIGVWTEMVFDMRELTAGYNDWSLSTITGLRFDFGTSASDVFQIDYIEICTGGNLLLPVNTTETIQSHFTSHSWPTPQAQVTAGSTYFMQPALSTASYEEVIDYGATLSTKATLTIPAATQVSGTVTITPTLSFSSDGVTWPPSQIFSATTAFVAGFRYVKIRLDFATSDNGLIVLPPPTLRLDMKLKTEQKMVSCLSGDSGGTNWNITGLFTDVQSITATPQGTTAVTAVYDFTDTPNPTGLKVLLFNSTTGARVSGTASVTVRGV